MKFRDVGLSLLGSAVVYVAMAACSSGGGSSSGIATKGYGGGGHGGSPAVAGTGGGTSGPSGGAGGSSGAGPRGDSGIFDALTDPVASASADPTSGTRLKAVYRTGADGSKEYLSGIWFDSQRSEQCTFSPAADGKQRCLPDGAAAQIYSDASCTTPLLSVATGCTPPAYAQTLLAEASCSTIVGGTHVYAVGASRSPSALYVQAGSSCYSAGPGATGFSYYSVGAEVPATSFVAATTGHD